MLRADRRSRRPGLGGARLRRPLRRSARSDRVAGAVRGADLAFPETRGERRGAGSAAFVCGTLLSGQAIARSGIAVAVWLNAGLLAATALAARLVPDRHRRLADEIRPQRPPLGDRRFADSSLEGDGFELSVPREEKPILRDGLCRFFPTLPFREGPNPSAFASRNVSAANSGTLGYLQDDPSIPQPLSGSAI